MLETLDNYDRMVGALEGLPDVIKVKPSTVRTVIPVVGLSQTFIIQTARQREVGDYIFLEGVSKDGSIRLVLPPQVADAIARQRESLTARSRSQAAKRVAQDRKDRGEAPAFQRGSKKRK